MKIVATSNKKKEAFKPITLNLQITLENQKDLDDLRDLGMGIITGTVEDEIYNDKTGNYHAFPINIIRKLADQVA